MMAFRRDKSFVQGVKAAASIAGSFDASSAHHYRLEDVILCKLNVVDRVKPRRNKKALAVGDHWLRGFALALAEMNRHPPGCDDTIAEVMRGAGVTIAMLRRAGVERCDIAELPAPKRRGARS